MKSRIQLKDHFTYGRLLRFVMPSIVMFVFLSFYGIVDGYFVSNYAGKTAFAGVNFIMPFLMIISCPGFMLGTGGSALVGKTLGEGDSQKANKLFSFFCYVTILTGIVMTVFSYFAIPYIVKKMGASGEMARVSILYGRILTISCVPQTLHFMFETFIVTAEKPSLGLRITLCSGIANMVLDALFVAVFGWGVKGAAYATVISESIGGFAPLVYFLLPNKSLLRIGKTQFDFSALLRGVTNGFSELLSNISMSLVSMLYNMQLMKYIGENGVAAYGVLMYVNFAFLSIFIGYAVGSAPIVSFHYGAGNKSELHNLLYKSIVIISSVGVLMLVVGETLARPISVMFAGYDENLLKLTVKAFRIFSVSFLFSGFSIYSSSYFTALNDGLTSASISFMRTMVFELLPVFLLPLIFGADGIWFSTVVAETMALVVSAIFLNKKQKKYGY